MGWGGTQGDRSGQGQGRCSIGWEAQARLLGAGLWCVSCPRAGDEARAAAEGWESPHHPEQLLSTCFTYGVVGGSVLHKVLQLKTLWHKCMGTVDGMVGETWGVWRGLGGEVREGCSDLIVLLTAQTKGQLELDVILRAAGRGLGERECEGARVGEAD